MVLARKNIFIPACAATILPLRLVNADLPLRADIVTRLNNTAQQSPESASISALLAIQIMIISGSWMPAGETRASFPA